MLKIVTTPKSFNGFYANREYAVMNTENRKIIFANTLWVFLDAKSLKHKKIPEEVYLDYGLQDDGKKYFTKLETIQSVKNCLRRENSKY